MTTSTLPEWDENRRCRSYSSWTNSISPEREDDFINSSSDDQSKQKHREGSLSSALSDISSSSSCFKPPPPKSEHLTVIVKNKKRRKDKEKRRSRHRSKKDKHKLFDRNPEESTSRTKEIFASGNNILVSVCFDNKDMDEEKKTKKKKKRRKKEKRRHKDRHKRDDVEVEEPKNWKKEPIVEKSRKKTDLKPVAIIDLDRSPKTRDITPKNVIVLSDDDTTGRGRVVKRKPESPVKKFLPLHLDDKHEVSSSIILPQEVDKIGPSTPPTPKSLMDKGAKNESSVNMSSTMSSHNSPVVSIDKFTESYDEDMLDLHATTPLNSPSPVKNAAQKKTYSRSANLSQPSSTSVAPSLPKKPTIHTIVLEDTDEGSISPYSPNSSDYEDLFEPPQSTTSVELTEANLKKVFGNEKDTLYGALRRNYKRAMLDRQRRMCPAPPPQAVTPMDDTFMDDIPNSAVDMQVKDKFVKKMHRQERVVEEVKLFLKPHFNKKTLTKDEYKDIFRRAVPKICHSRSGEINPVKIQALCNAYVKKAISKRKVSVKSVTSGNAIVSSTTTSIS